MFDIEINPGPYIPKYPCGSCGRAVSNKQAAVSCDACDQWFHIKCQGMSQQTYNDSIGVDFSWTCSACTLSNIQVTMLNDTTSPTSTKSDPGSPLAHSSPTRQNNHYHCNKRQLTLININCQSITNKKGDLQSLIDTHNPDIICATETWLSKNHTDGEICMSLLDQYDLFRKDRDSRQGGGVLIATKKELQAEHQTNLDTSCEALWVSIKLQAARTLYVCSFYRPNCQDETSSVALRDALNRIPSHSNIIVAGDFNYPDIDWQRKTMQAQSTTRRLHDEFIELVDDFTLTQHVNSPTRLNRILDLVLTNAPGNCSSCIVIPGISDHEAIHAMFEFQAVRHKQPARKIPLYNKADWEGYHKHMVEFHNNFMAEGTSTATVDDAWNKFKQSILRGAAKFVPHKTARSTNKKPWISRETVRQIRQRNRAYQRKRRTRNQHDQDRYRDLKHKTQKKIRQDYWKYLEDIVTPSEGNNTRAANKKFWSFVKHTRQDSVGIPNLIDAQGDEHTTPQGKAQALNQQFASVFSDIRPSSLKDMASLLIRPMFPYMRPLCFKTAGISKLLGGLDNNKAPGPDGIHPRILRQLNLAIAPTLQVIFEKTYREGVVPEDWRRANICPIYKKKEQERTQPITGQYPLHVLLVNYLST